jgi:hypothetical protein
VPDLDSLISEVSGNGSLAGREVQGRDGRWYSLRMRPYKTAENKIEGVLPLTAVFGVPAQPLGPPSPRLQPPGWRRPIPPRWENASVHVRPLSLLYEITPARSARQGRKTAGRVARITVAGAPLPTGAEMGSLVL